MNELLIEIGKATVAWYDLKQQAAKLREERGSHFCGCGEWESSCYREWTVDAQRFDEMMECEIAKHYYNASPAYWKIASKAGGAKNRLNHLVKKYQNLKNLLQ